MPVPEHTEIETDRLKIRLIKESDVPALFAINGDDAVTRFLPYETWKNSADGATWFERTSARLSAGEADQFVIVLRETGHIIGTCLLFRFDRASARAELGYVLARRYWGAGYMLEALQALIGFAFAQMGLRRLEAEIDPRNVASARLLRRLGFVREGVLRQRSSTKGEITDSGLYGLLSAEWPPALPKRGQRSARRKVVRDLAQ